MPKTATNSDLTSGIEKGVPIPESKPRMRSVGSERVKIVIDESGNPKDSQYVFVSINGRAYQIRRGVEVEVPVEILNVLNDAVESRLIKDADDEWTTKSFLRFPFRKVS